jgi:hypothetical protein
VGSSFGIDSTIKGYLSYQIYPGLSTDLVKLYIASVGHQGHWDFHPVLDVVINCVDCTNVATCLGGGGGNLGLSTESTLV